MNNCVSFKLAKLLKEKGFNEPTHSFYVIDESEYGELEELITDPDENYPSLGDNTLYDTLASAPTVAEAVMWLYNKYKIWISVDFDSKNWFEVITLIKENDRIVQNNYNSPTEAYESAIEYTLNKLV